MKDRKIILCIFGIIVVSALLVVIVKNNKKEYIMYDGALLALTVDGAPVTSFPNNTNKYHVDITCENGKGIGQYLPIKEDNYNLKLIIKNITKNGVKCYVDFTTITENNSSYLISSIVQNTALEQKTENNVGKIDISYRYNGKSPNNWVWFNNEKWRIIGLMPVCTTSGCGTSDTKLVKIIKNENIGGLAYDAKSSGHTGVWGNNTLYTLLNNYYYGKSNGSETNYCKSYKSLIPSNCNYSDIGISNDSNDYYGKMVKNVYWNTGPSSGSPTVSQVYKSETATQTISGKIGLMSASDFGYAGTDFTSSIDSWDIVPSASTNWLFSQGYEWTSTHSSSNLSNVHYIIGVGSLPLDVTYMTYVVRPTLYLDASVYVISGEGTESNPYILGM